MWERVEAENLVRHVSGSYYLQAKIAGKKIRRSLGTSNLRAAKVARDKLLAELRARAGVARGPVMLADAIARTRAWYADLPHYKSKPASMRYRMQLLAVLADTLPKHAVHLWKREELAAWWASPAVSRFSPMRRNNLLGTLKKLLELAGASPLLAAELRRVKVPRKIRQLPARGQLDAILAEIRAVGNARSVEAANLTAFMAYSGLRIAEARAVQWEDIEADWIVVRGGASGTKSGHERRVPIIPAMRGLLESLRYDGACGPVFYMATPRHALENACKRLGVPHLTPHGLRHIFATSCVEAGVDFRTLAEWLGHQDGGLLAARTYSHIRSEHAKELAGKVRV